MVMLLVSLPLLLVLVLLPLSVTPSRGDRDYTFHNCLKQCTSLDCDGREYRNQTAYMKFLGWDCGCECQYRCMWNTVAIFQEHNLDIPQFFGKWPFIRIFGIQEPASVIASLLNFIAHVYSLRLFRKKVPSEAPLFWLWHLFAIIFLNGWVWSTVFHTRDLPWTELMDYFSAFSMIVYSFFTIFPRLMEKVMCAPVLVGAGVAFTMYSYHVYYLAFIHFDYGYNMAANVTVGVLNAAFWIVWSVANRKAQPYSWKCTLFMSLATASILLEVNDFPPILWTLDAHALWHFVTAPITPIWYSFVTDDCNYLHNKGKLKYM